MGAVVSAVYGSGLSCLGFRGWPRSQEWGVIVSSSALPVVCLASLLAVYPAIEARAAKGLRGLGYVGSGMSLRRRSVPCTSTTSSPKPSSWEPRDKLPCGTEDEIAIATVTVATIIVVNAVPVVVIMTEWL